MDEENVNAQLTLLKNRSQTHHFISAAQDITRGMGGAASEHFAEWLERTVGSIKARDRRVLDALDAVRHQGNLLATTNYDGLLVDGNKDLTAITWLNSDDLIAAVRKGDIDKVIFLHGYRRRPESVILDWKSYDRIVRDKDYREDFDAFWKTHIWVYVGCGVNGLGDPDFGLLLKRYGERARQSGHWDYCLLLDGQRDEFQAHFDTNKMNIRAIAIGETHACLPDYLRSLLPPTASTDSDAAVNAVPTPVASAQPAIPKAPAFYAEPDYIGSHRFVGRRAELEALNDWGAPSDPTNLLLFEAIGGNGKSMLTWEWTTQYATRVRGDWAGRFWYSFYEKGAVMADFCRRALAYITGRPLEDFAKKKTSQLKDELLAMLHARPWLIVLDGLERVLVAYHRIDAADVRDEEFNTPTDKIAHRNPCEAIRDEDNDLLRALCATAPSKILVSSRLTPRVMLNPSGQPIPGARRVTLPGLRPLDAEKLLYSCGIEGDSAAIQNYLSTNCDNHPLVIGILGGLIRNYLPARGNFDAWAADPEGGAKLDLASLDLIQRRNHILKTAVEDLPPASRELLSTLALLSESVDYETLSAFNPHLPPEPEEVQKPVLSEEESDWEIQSEDEKVEIRKQYQADLARWQDYEKNEQAWRASKEYREAPKKLTETVRDLEQRGLLQYDGRTRRHDLHPVVRGVAAGGLIAEDKERYGQRVVDHFSSLPHSPYGDAETLEDLRPGLSMVRTLLKLGHFQQALNAYTDDLRYALLFNLDANVEILSLLRPFFPDGWCSLPQGVTSFRTDDVITDAAITLIDSGAFTEGFSISVNMLNRCLEAEDWSNAIVDLTNITVNQANQNLIASAFRVDCLNLKFASAIGDQGALFTNRLSHFWVQSLIGQWAEAEAIWQLLDPMGRDWSRAIYRSGNAEYFLAQFQFWKQTLQEEHLSAAERLAQEGRNRSTIRILHNLRGAWRLDQGEWALAAKSFAEALRMARERGIPDAKSETGLALAKYHLVQLTDPRREAERLTQLRDPAHRYLARLWMALGDTAQARKHALAAYKWAWADGEPYVRRYELTKATELLNELKVPIPDLPPYDPTKDEPFPWEAKVRAVIETLRAEKEEKAKKKDSD